MVQKLTSFDPAQHLLSDEAMADFLDAASKTNDVVYIAHAHRVVAQAKANQFGLPNERGRVSALTDKKST